MGGGDYDGPQVIKTYDRRDSSSLTEDVLCRSPDIISFGGVCACIGVWVVMLRVYVCMCVMCVCVCVCMCACLCVRACWLLEKGGRSPEAVTCADAGRRLAVVHHSALVVAVVLRLKRQ